jgi:dienelactone hydrolase
MDMKETRTVASAAKKAAVAVVMLGLAGPVAGQRPVESRLDRLQEPDRFVWTPPEELGLEQWNRRREELRFRVLVSAGLWPELPRTDLKAEVFGWSEGRGFRVARVHFESVPGFLVTGNLYVPTDGEGPFPAILTPHGHWQFGRLDNREEGSIPGRCIDLARQGFVVFSPDMIGYLDSFQMPHDHNKSRAELKADEPLPYEHRVFRGDFDFPEAELDGLSLGGLHLWNNIRALDFLTSLPEVDGNRLGVTGASGGATQTILLMAVDDRVRAAAPVNIIGMEKHPGCRCENFPGLWLDTSTLEIAATFAPKPLLLVSATRDPWTHATPEREYPALRRYYRLYDAEANIANVHVDAGHNFNAESRAGVYAWLGRHLSPRGRAVADPPPVSAEVRELGDLRVFPDKILPEGALPALRIIADWNARSETMALAALPAGTEDVESFATQFRRGLRILLGIAIPEPDELAYEIDMVESRDGFVYEREMIGRESRGDWIELESLRRTETPTGVVLLVMPERFGSLSGRTLLSGPIESLVRQDLQIYRVRGYASGQLRIPGAVWDSLSWPAAYNQGNPLLAAQDIVTALAAVRDAHPDRPIVLVGLADAGLPAVFAAAVSGLAGRLLVDLEGQDPGHAGTLLARFPAGALRRLGDFRTAAALQLAVGRLLLLNPSPSFDAAWYRELARRMGQSERLVVHEAVPLSDPYFERLLSDLALR